MKPVQLASVFVVATSTLAMAQDKVQISYSGIVSVEHLVESDYSEDFFYGNGDVSFRWSTASDLKFGVDLGVESLRLLSNDTSYFNLGGYYASGIVEGRFGKISFGTPRSVMVQYFAAPKIAGSELYDLEIGFFGTELVRYVNLLSSEVDGDLYGARYDGKFGKFSVAGSVYRLSNFGNNDDSANIKEIVAQYDAGHWSVTLGEVLFDQGGISTSSTSVEVQGQSGKFSGGVVLSRLNEQILDLGSSDSADLSMYRAFVSYDINEALKLSGQVFNYQFLESFDENFYSVDVSYTHESGAFFNAGLMTREDFADKVVNLSLGYKF